MAAAGKALAPAPAAAPGSRGPARLIGRLCHTLRGRAARWARALAWRRARTLPYTPDSVLDELAERIARLEIALMREQRSSTRQSRRAEEAENAVIRLQSTLDGLRREMTPPPVPGPLRIEANLTLQPFTAERSWRSGLHAQPV